MKTISWTYDHDIIKSLLGVGNVYESLAYDGSPPLDEYVPTGMWYLLKEGRNTAGFINFVELTNVTFMCHIFIFEQFRGNGSEQWGQQAAAYMREYVGAKKFLALTPYVAAKRYAEKVGFVQVGVLTKSVQKNGELMDQFLLEMS